jgi:hypothetical protein
VGREEPSVVDKEQVSLKGRLRFGRVKGRVSEDSGTMKGTASEERPSEGGDNGISNGRV